MRKKNQNRRKKPIKNRKLKKFGKKVSNKLKAFGKNVFNKERGHLQLLNTEIVFEPMQDTAYANLHDSVKKQAEDLYELIYSESPENAISPLLALIEKYPHIPQFKNFLSVAYSNMGDDEKANEIVIETCKQHPDYLLGKTNYASICLQKGEFEKVPEIFDNKVALELLYPHRKKFHVTEYCSFSAIMALYYIELDQGEIKVGQVELDSLEIAYRYYKTVLDLDPDSPLIARMERHFMLKILDPGKLKQRLDEMKSEMSLEELKELEETKKMSDEEFEKWESEREVSDSEISDEDQAKYDEELAKYSKELSEFEKFKLEMIKKFLLERAFLDDESSESTEELLDKSKD